MKLTREEAIEVVHNGSNDWRLIDENIEDEYKMVLYMQGIFQHVPTGDFYEFYWGRSTDSWELDDEYVFHEEIVEPTQVKKTLVTIEKWMPVK